MPLGDFSLICFEFLGDIWRKSQKGAKKGKTGQNKNRATSPRSKKATPRVRCSVAVLHSNEALRRSVVVLRSGKVTVHTSQNFILFSKVLYSYLDSLRTLIND